MQMVVPEEAARADLYALLARLFYAGPDAALLDAIGSADNLVAAGPSDLSQSWAQFRMMCQSANPELASDEHTRLFVGVGKAPISVYASHYLTENYKELTLVHLRDELERLGLARKADIAEPEDHIAGLLEVMRHLVQRNAADPGSQAAFFRSYLQPWHEKFCAAVVSFEGASFYRALCHLMKSYFAVEVEYFEWTV